MKDAVTSRTVVVTITTLVQMILSMGVLSLPITGPYAAAEIGLPPLVVGLQISVIYACGMLSSLIAARLVRRLGGARTSQLALVIMAAGLVILMVPTLATMVAGAMLVGVAYGVPNPAASHVLNRFLDMRNRNLLFSIKQAGVPLGGIMAGFVAAPLAEWTDWRLGVLVPAAGCLLLMAAIIPVRRYWDDDRDPRISLIRDSFAGFALILRIPAPRLIFCSAIILSSAQMCLSTFLVLLLIVDYGYTPVTAGALMAAFQTAGMVGRLFWGVFADWLRSGVLALALLSLMLSGLTATLALVDLIHAHAVLFVVLLGLGLSASGWPGVIIAEIDRFAPRGHTSEATATLMIGTFSGVAVGTALFTALIPLFGSYRDTFLAPSVTTALAAVLFFTIVRLTRR